MHSLPAQAADTVTPRDQTQHFETALTMNKPASSPRWFARWRAAETTAEDDPADLGTAFGLDLSMDDTTPQPLPTPPVAQPGWMQRITSRRKPA